MDPADLFLERGHTDIQTDKITIATDYLTHDSATAGVGNKYLNADKTLYLASWQCLRSSRLSHAKVILACGVGVILILILY